MNQPLLQQLPLGSDYPIPSERECIDSIGSHGQHSPFGNGRDSLSETTNLLSLPHGNSLHCMPSRNSHQTGYHGANLSDSGSGSISTSPSSNASSLAFSYSSNGVYPQSNSAMSIANPYPGASQVYSSSFAFPHSLSGMSHARPRLSPITVPSTPGMLPPTRSQGLSHPHSPTVRDNYTTSTPGLNRHLVSPRSQLDSLSRGPYAISDSPRAMLSTHNSMPLSSPNYVNSAATFTHSSRGQPETPPFQDQENLLDIRTEENVAVNPEIQAKVEKGFFMSHDNCWTCYRRNYFSIQCSYSLDPHLSNRPLFVMRSDKKSGSSNLEQIQAMAMSLSAAVDGTSGKAVDLVQHTPKRDRGPQTAVQRTKLLPTPPGSKEPQIAPDHHGFSMGTFGISAQPSTSISPPYLPHQQNQDMAPSSSADPSGSSANSAASYSGAHSTPQATSHTFERIQFKSATANNGKRRAQQQYYHLIVELWADVRQPSDREPNWVKVAERSSSQVVVRGRSPSHYSNEGPNSVGRGGSAGGLNGGNSMAPGSWPMSGGMGGHHGFGGNSSSLSRYGSMGSGGSGVFHSLGEHHSASASHPTDLQHLTSLSSIVLPTVDSLSLPSSSTSSGSLLPTQLEDRISDADPKSDAKLDSYTYFPGPLYEAGLASPKSSVKPEHQGNRSDEPTSNHTASYTLPSPWAAGSCRLMGMESSRGLYPWSTVNHEASY